MPLLACKYAGILGTVAMFVVIVRAAKEAASPAAAVGEAIAFLAAFAAAGFVIGWVADTLIVESVRTQIEEHLRSSSPSLPDTQPTTK
jgi:hypothetical protein